MRLSGKRTLAKISAFDPVVTVALGSTLTTILLSRDVALLEGMTALLTLVALQAGKLPGTLWLLVGCGVLVAVAQRHAIPIHFIGVGEKAEDLQPFDATSFARALVGLST